MSNPLGMRIGIVRKGSRVIQESNNRIYIMPESIKVNLLVQRNPNYLAFVYKGNTYLIHPDNVEY